MNTVEIFLIAMLIIFAVSYMVLRLGRIDHCAPLVVVQIIAGIALGPGLLGAEFPDHYTFVFNPTVVQTLNGTGCWAVMLLAGWLAGIGLDLGQAWLHRRESSITAALALGVPLLLGCAVAASACSPRARAGWPRARCTGSSSPASARPTP